MSDVDKAYIARYATKGSFEMAKFPNQYVPTRCYLVGAIAITRNGSEWSMSHSATGMGMPGIFGRTLIEAVRVARSIDSAVPWSKIKRTEKVGVVSGFTKARKESVFAMALTFRHIAERAGKVRKAVAA